MRNALLKAEALETDGDPFGAQAGLLEALSKMLDLPQAQRETWLPEALAALYRLSSALRATAEYPASLEVLSRWASLLGARADPGAGDSAAQLQVSALARMLLARATLEATGSSAEVEAAGRPLGLLVSWKIVGPFESERGGGFRVEYGPEKEPVRLDATYQGKKRAVTWRSLPSAPLEGRVDLARLLDPSEEALAYALTHVKAARSQEAVLFLSTDESYRVWVNGRQLAAEDLQRVFGLGPDQTAVPVKLERGFNSILLKVCQTKGPWRFAARLAGPDFRPLGDVAEEWPLPGEAVPWIRQEGAPKDGDPQDGSSQDGAPPEGAQAAEKPASPLAGPPLAHPVGAILQMRLEADMSDARAHYLRGLLSLERGAHDRTVHPDTESLLRACQLESTVPVYWLDLARSHEREASIAAQKDENLRRQSLEKASTLGSALADLELARYYFETFANSSVALEHVERALARNPRFQDAILLRGEIEESLGFPRAKERALEEAWSISPRTPRVCFEQAKFLVGRGKVGEAESVLRDLLGRNASSGEARERLAFLLSVLDRVNDGRAILEAGRAVDPWNTSFDEGLARLLEGRGLVAEALAAVDHALRVRPESHALQEERGRLLLIAGRKEEAIAALEKAIELQPNLPRVREHVEFLRAAGSRFEDELRRDVAAIVKEALAATDANAAGDPTRILLDLTAIEVNPDGTTKEFSQKVVQVLNDLGVGAYDRFGAIYAAGEELVEFRKARVHHRDGTTSDAPLSRHGGEETESFGYRGAIVDLPPIAPGDVVEIEYIREDLAQSFFGDYFGHRVVFQESVPVREKVFSLRVPSGRRFHFHRRNLELEPAVERDEKRGKTTYTWIQKDVPRLEQEPAMPSSVEISPVLEVSTFESWDAFSRWYWNLIRKQFETSPEISRKVRELTSGAGTDEEKIRAIYNFVVTDIRYNAWPFGVHGFKPYNAATIFARSFGDCKDKATLMSVMLSEVGIRAWPVLIHATPGRWDEDLSLPIVNHFNHVITYVPARGALPELYLDGTAQFHNVRELPFTDLGAKVFVVRDDGGSLQRIPWGDPEGQSHVEEVTVVIRPDMGADLVVRGRSRGMYAATIRKTFEIAAQRSENLERNYGRRFAGASVKDLSFSNLGNLDESVSFSVSIDVPRILEEAPEGLVVRSPEDIFSSDTFLEEVTALEKRTRDFIIPRGSHRTELKVAYHLAQGLRAKSLPATQDLSGRFGRLKSIHRSDEPGKVVSERMIELTAPRVAVSDYAEFREFAAAINRLKTERILLERN